MSGFARRLGSPSAYRMMRAGVGIGMAVIVSTYLYFLLRQGTAIETHWLPDALYIMNAAWTVHAGYVPNVDFIDRYGGLLTRLLSLSMTFSGPSMKALDYTIAAILLLGALMLALVAIGRLRLLSATSAFLVVVALIVTRAPLEQPFALRTASYATLYNRVAWVLLFIGYIVSAIPRTRRGGVPAIVVAGIASAAMVLTKISFGLGLPVIAAGFLLRGARRECAIWIGAFLGGLVLFWLVLGMGPLEWVRMTGAAAHLAGGEPRLGAFVKAGYLIVYNGASVAAMLFACGLLVRDERARATPIVVTTLIMMGLSLGITVTTGLFSLHETTSPALAMTAVAMVGHLEKRRPSTIGYWFPLGFCILSFAVPHLANGAWASSRRADHWGIRAADTGALSTLSIRPAEVLRSRSTPEQFDVTGLAKDLSTFHSLEILSDQDKLLVIRDAIKQIVQLPGYEKLGILSPGERVFPFVLGAKPITSIDLWLTSADFADAPDRPLPADIDAIAVTRWWLSEDADVTPLLMRRARKDFYLCRQSALWTIYLRRSVETRQAAQGCASGR